MESENSSFENDCEELKRHLSRLSYVGMGLSDTLDLSLADLRKLIKTNAPQQKIKENIDAISIVLRGLDDEPKKSQVTLVNEEINLIELLTQQKLPPLLKSNLTKVNKKSKAQDASSIMISIAKEIKCYVDDIESTVREQNNPVTSSEKKTGFFGSLFSKKGTSKTGGTQKSNSDSQAEKTNTNNNELTHHLLPSDIKISLQHLVEQLASMDGYKEIAALLEVETKKVQTISQLSSILELIASAFLEVSDQEHMQFESFLNSLNKRIVRVNDFISNTLIFSKGCDGNSKKLNDDLVEDISSIKKSLNESNNLAEVEETIASKMDNMLIQINQFCENQQHQSQTLTSQVEKLKEQMIATEDEASRLKDDLAEQRVRAQTDQLTNLPNRYAYNERLTQEYNRWRRYRNSLTLVIGDIDLFKGVNDTHGHSFGDLVLKKVASCLHAEIRESDFVARFGGEEFVILLPETSLIDATRAMNKMRQSINKIELENEGVKIAITMSFGISEFTNDDTTKAVFERADSALYRAKEKGRNKVCCQRPQVTPNKN